MWRHSMLAILVVAAVAHASSVTERLGLCVPTPGDPPGWGANCVNPSLTLLDKAMLTDRPAEWTAPQSCGPGCTLQGVGGGRIIASQFGLNPTNCEPGFYPTGIDEFGAVEGCSALLASLTIPAGALALTGNASGSATLYQVPSGTKKAHVMVAWASTYNTDTNAANNDSLTPACNGKTWVQGVVGSEVANSTLAVALTDTTTCPTLTDASAHAPSSALTGTNSVLLEQELVIFAGKSGNQLTPCTRGASGTVATTHSVGIPAPQYNEKRLVDIWSPALVNACRDTDCTDVKVPCHCCTDAENSACTGAAASVPSSMSVPTLDVPLVPGGIVRCTLAGSSASKCHVACGFNGYLDP